MGICEENEDDNRKRMLDEKLTLNSSDRIQDDEIEIKEKKEKIKEINNIVSGKNKVTIDTNLITSGGTSDPKYDYHKIKLLG